MGANGCPPDDTTGFVPDSYIHMSEQALAPIFGPLVQTVLVHTGLPLPQVTLVDLGGGNGMWSNAFLDAGARHCLLIDHLPAMADYAAQALSAHFSEERWACVVGDAQALPLAEASVHLVVSRNSMHLWSNLALAWQETFRIIKPGGWAFIGRGYGPDLPRETRQQVKEARKALRHPNDPPHEEPPSPPPEQVRDIVKKIGFEKVDIISDGKPYWIVAHKL